MNPRQWLSLHKPSAHFVTAASSVVVALFAKDEAFRAWVMGLYRGTPPWLHEMIAGLIIPVFTYWRTQRENVAVATAQPGGTATATATATADEKPAV